METNTLQQNLLPCCSAFVMGGVIQDGEFKLPDMLCTTAQFLPDGGLEERRNLLSVRYGGCFLRNEAVFLQFSDLFVIFRITHTGNRILYANLLTY